MRVVELIHALSDVPLMAEVEIWIGGETTSVDQVSLAWIEPGGFNPNPVERPNTRPVVTIA